MSVQTKKHSSGKKRPSQNKEKYHINKAGKVVCTRISSNTLWALLPTDIRCKAQTYLAHEKFGESNKNTRSLLSLIHI